MPSAFKCRPTEATPVGYHHEPLHYQDNIVEEAANPPSPSVLNMTSPVRNVWLVTGRASHNHFSQTVQPQQRMQRNSIPKSYDRPWLTNRKVLRRMAYHWLATSGTLLSWLTIS